MKDYLGVAVVLPYSSSYCIVQDPGRSRPAANPVVTRDCSVDAAGEMVDAFTADAPFNLELKE